MHTLRQLIRSAVESFPIDRERKELILRRLLHNRNRGKKKP